MAGYEYTPTPTEDSELLLGSDGNDTINGLGGSDVILGDAGNDDIDGGAGRDIIRGGGGGDDIDGGADGDIIRGDSGNDTIDGDAGNDLLLGDAGNDLIDGGVGNDTIFGGTGDDTLTGGAGNDTFLFIESSGNDTITDFDIDDDLIDLSMIQEAIAFSELTITDLSDNSGVTITHSALGGTITLTGVTKSQLTASQFNLPDGSTTSLTTDENDEVHRYSNPVEGTDSSDIILESSNSTRIVAKGGDDLILAGEGNDSIEGGAGNDTLLGEEGDDTIQGAAGDDWLYGGSGNDTFVFEAGHGNDTIHDFTDGEDLIDLTAFTGITGFNDLSISANDGDVVIDLSSDGGGEIRIEDFDSTNLGADDFAF